MRLIDADELPIKTVTIPCDSHKVTVVACLVRDIDTAQTIDAAPVVRCKDCKHKTEDNIRRMFCSIYRFETLADFYCAHGEKLEGSK